MKYFSYGSNCCKSNMAKRCPGAVAIGTVTLQGWKLSTGMYCNVIEDKNSSVIGVLWDITKEDENSLDQYEGFPTYYTKKTIDTEQGPALIYIMQPHHAENSQNHVPTEYYSKLVGEAYIDWKIPIMQYVNSISDAVVFNTNRI